MLQSTCSGAAALSNVTVTSASPDQNYTDYGELYIGNGYALGYCRTAFRVNSLPQLRPSDVVVYSGLTLTSMLYSSYSPAHAGNIVIDLYPVTEETAFSSLTWNTVSAVTGSIAIDSEYVTQAEASGQHPKITFDITKEVKKWYLTGENYGIVMASENESPDTMRTLMLYSAAGASTAPWDRPLFTVSYINQEGLSDYLTYHTAGGGSMGTLHVGDFSGNLLYTYNDLAMTGAYLPVSVSHVYSHSMKEEADVVGGGMRYGKGFRLNLSVRAAVSGVEGYPYQLTDEDGTVHWFRLVSGTVWTPGSVYEEAYNSSRIFTQTETGYVVTDGSSRTLTFNSAGYLTSVYDAVSMKSQTFSYTDGRLASVTDGAGRTVTLTYNTAGYLTALTDPSGRTVSYTYSSDGYLTEITRPDGTSVELVYETVQGSKALTEVRDPDGSYVAIAYTAASPCRVSSLTEYGNDSSEGRKLTWTYAPGETTVTDRQGRSETMLFDRSGHTVVVRDHAGNAFYGSYQGSEDDRKHALLYSSSMQGTVTNYLTNHGFEEGSAYTGWAQWNPNGTGTLSVETSPQNVKEGEKSLKVTSASSAVTWGIRQNSTVPGVQGEAVTLSCMLKFDGYTPGPGAKGFRLIIRYKDASGSWVSEYSPVLIPAEGWQRYSHSIIVPEEAGSETLQAALVFHLSTGTVYIDDVQLEKGAVSNRYNLLENGHFRDYLGTAVPAGWETDGTAAGDQVVSTGHDGKGYRIYGMPVRKNSCTRPYRSGTGIRGILMASAPGRRRKRSRNRAFITRRRSARLQSGSGL